MKTDNLDLDILNVLLNNSRLSYRQIAKKAKVSAATVMHRINAMEKEGIIKKYSVYLDFEKLGYDFMVVVSLKISKGKLFEVEKKIAQEPNVTSVYDVLGDSDAVLFGKFKTKKSMDQFIKRIQTYDFVEWTKSFFVMNVIKKDRIYLT